MKKSSTPSAKYVGDGIYLVENNSELEKRPTPPVNTGKTYFKWNMAATNLLMKQCLDKEMWNVSYGTAEKRWMDLCVTLRTFPNYEQFFANLTWRSCEREYEWNIKLYIEDKTAAPFQSGTDQQHTEWKDMLEDIIQCMQDKDLAKGDAHKTDVQDPQNPKQVEQEMKAVGEFLREDQLLNFTNQKARKILLRNTRDMRSYPYKISLHLHLSENLKETILKVYRTVIQFLSRFESEM